MQSEQKSDKSTGTSEMQIGFEFKVRSKISASPVWQRKNNDLTNKYNLTIDFLYYQHLIAYSYNKD